MPRIVLAALSAALLACGAPSRVAWQRGAVCYEIFVRSFYDSDGDGIGDLNGLVQKLDYVGGLGARCIWLMPVTESPSYHGYDVTDYYRVEPDYGTNADFKRLVREAHRRGIRVLVDLVLNHASSEHPTFREALRDPGSPYRDWFLWSADHPGVKNPWGGDNWHRSPVRDEYYYGFFWSGMPDLNYETPAVREEAKKVATFWIEEMGVDGFRLDAIKHLVERDDGRVVEHVPATHEFLREFAAHLRRVAPDAFTIGEVWDSIGAMLPYYPDQLDAYFAFEASDAIIESVRTGSARGLLRPFLRLQRDAPAGSWAPFLRNHDQTRTVTALGGDVARARLAATLLLTLPGLPFVYYGEEIGMTGDKPDPRLRTPMHWTRGPAAGFTRGTAWEPLHPDSFTANVETQEADAHSLLNLYRRLIRLRAEHPTLGAGELVALSASHDAVAAYVRRDGARAVMVIANLGTARLAGVSLASEGGVLPPGRYAATSLLDGRQAEPLVLGSDGRVRDYVPAPTLEPMESYVIELATVP
ncbi:MAG: alpha-amylase family glycosyl hydrolase [Gemmatimonadales bacterium]